MFFTRQWVCGVVAAISLTAHAENMVGGEIYADDGQVLPDHATAFFQDALPEAFQAKYAGRATFVVYTAYIKLPAGAICHAFAGLVPSTRISRMPRLRATADHISDRVGAEIGDQIDCREKAGRLAVQKFVRIPSATIDRSLQAQP